MTQIIIQKKIQFAYEVFILLNYIKEDLHHGTSKSVTRKCNFSGAKTGGSVVWRARVTGGMAGNLFLRALERSDRIYMAMASRGYDGEVRAMPLPSLRPVHWIITGVSLAVFIALLGLAYLL